MSDEVITRAGADEAAVVGTSGALTVSTDKKLVNANASRDKLFVSCTVADVWLYYGVGPAVVGSGHCVRVGANPFVEESWKGEVHVISTGAAVVGFTETEFAVGEAGGEAPTGAAAFIPSGPGDTTPTASLPVTGE